MRREIGLIVVMVGLLIAGLVMTVRLYGGLPWRLYGLGAMVICPVFALLVIGTLVSDARARRNSF